MTGRDDSKPGIGELRSIHHRRALFCRPAASHPSTAALPRRARHSGGLYVCAMTPIGGQFNCPACPVASRPD